MRAAAALLPWLDPGAAAVLVVLLPASREPAQLSRLQGCPGTAARLVGVAPGCLMEEPPAPRPRGCQEVTLEPRRCWLCCARIKEEQQPAWWCCSLDPGGSPRAAALLPHGASWWPCMNESGCSPVALVGSWSRGGAGCVAASIQEPAQLSRLQGCPGAARPVASRAILTRHLLQNL